MRIISFNVNGLRARLHQLQDVIDQHNPDIIGLQETKVSNEEFPLEAVNAMGYQVDIHGQKGHLKISGQQACASSWCTASCWGAPVLRHRLC